MRLKLRQKNKQAYIRNEEKEMAEIYDDKKRTAEALEKLAGIQNNTNIHYQDDKRIAMALEKLAETGIPSGESSEESATVNIDPDDILSKIYAKVKMRGYSESMTFSLPSYPYMIEEVIGSGNSCPNYEQINHPGIIVGVNGTDYYFKRSTETDDNSRTYRVYRSDSAPYGLYFRYEVNGNSSGQWQVCGEPGNTVTIGPAYYIDASKIDPSYMPEEVASRDPLEERVYSFYRLVKTSDRMDTTYNAIAGPGYDINVGIGSFVTNVEDATYQRDSGFYTFTEGEKAIIYVNNVPYIFTATNVHIPTPPSSSGSGVVAEGEDNKRWRLECPYANFYVYYDHYQETWVFKSDTEYETTQSTYGPVRIIDETKLNTNLINVNDYTLYLGTEPTTLLEVLNELREGILGVEAIPYTLEPVEVEETVEETVEP